MYVNLMILSRCLFILLVIQTESILNNYTSVPVSVYVRNDRSTKCGIHLDKLKILIPSFLKLIAMPMYRSFKCT